MRPGCSPRFFVQSVQPEVHGVLGDAIGHSEGSVLGQGPFTTLKMAEIPSELVVARGRSSGEAPFELPSEGPKPSMLLWVWAVHYPTGLQGLQTCENYVTFSIVTENYESSAETG